MWKIKQMLQKFEGVRDSLIEIFHFNIWRPMTACLSNHVCCYECAFLISYGATGNSISPIRNLHPNLAPSAEMHDITGICSGLCSVSRHCISADDTDRTRERPGGTVAFKFQQVVDRCGVLDRLIIDIVVNLREDMVIAADWDYERLVGLVEDHSPIHKGMGIVPGTRGILTTLPPLLVPLSQEG